MPDKDNGHLKIWGRANSVNVQKVLWCCRELELSYERIDAGMQFGRNTEPDYLAMNPNGRVPAIDDPNTGVVTWEVSTKGPDKTHCLCLLAVVWRLYRVSP